MPKPGQWESSQVLCFAHASYIRKMNEFAKSLPGR